MEENILAANKARVLVVLEPHPETPRLLRVAKRKAEMLGVDWEVLYIKTKKIRSRLSKADIENLDSMASLAEEMGAIVTRHTAKTMMFGIGEIIAQRAEQQVPIAHIKIAEIRKKRGWFGLRYPLEKKLRAAFDNKIRIVTVPLGIEGGRKAPLLKLFHVTMEEIFISLLAVVIATFMIEIIRDFNPSVFGPNNRNKIIVYLIACAFTAGRYGFVAGLVTSTASFFTLSMLYIVPYYSLRIDGSGDAMLLFLFTLAGLVISVIGNQGYGNRVSLNRRAERFHSLLQIHRLALNNNSMYEAVETMDKELKALLATDVAIFLPSEKLENKLETIFHENVELNLAEQEAIRISWEESRTTGVGTAYNCKGCRWRFEPLITAHDEVGVLAILITRRIELDHEAMRLMSGVADQVALILERLQMEQIMEGSKVQAEREKLRSMLLSSVSHDLKTPLASVIGSLSVYRSVRYQLSEEDKVTLINTALDEAQRLDSFITNILDMTRIESGQIELKAEWMNPAELVAEVAGRLRERLRGHTLIVLPSPDNIEVEMDPIMTGQVIQNLIDNAAKYTNFGTKIEVSWKVDMNGFSLSVRDYGAGIPEESIDKVFDKYARIVKQDSKVAGTGLGLAIAKAVMQTQGGNIHADNHPEGGAIFTITLPATRELKQGE